MPEHDRLISREFIIFIRRALHMRAARAREISIGQYCFRAEIAREVVIYEKEREGKEEEERRKRIDIWA